MYMMAVKINWHRYETELRHCHPMHNAPSPNGPITIAIRARFEHDTTSYEELCAFEQ